MNASIKVEEELFAAAFALPPQERARYLHRACGDDEHLRGRVESLLATVDPATRFLGRLGCVASMQGSAEHIDATIGPYTLLDEIGEGGSSVVFRAAQVAPLRREVALKIVKLGMDTKAVIARFNAERQVLALMDHPNIATVLDAGVAPSGRPYFVMELVRGLRITKYCDQARLSAAERLALFVQVCHAVQHAHNKGVVHRDIKPSNVLVTLHDGAPMIKVIDFGIAKAMQGRLADQTLFTALDQFMGTPAYVSPEQTDSAADIDARSDVYSLGVLLYELLTGCMPFDSSESSSGSVDELLRRVRSEEPPTPSKRLHALDKEPLTATASGRQTTPARLKELIHGDLDWIVMRCLEKDRERRYPSADALAEEVQRFLNHEPVMARPPGVVYSMRKLTKRHRVAFVAGAMILVMLMLATAVSSWLAIRARRAEKLAQTEVVARQEVIDFLRNDLLAQAAPEQGPDRDLKLRTVLDRAAGKIQGRFTDQPLVEASIRVTLADTYTWLGEYAAAKTHFDRALQLYERQLGKTDSATFSVSRRIVENLSDQGRYAEAAQLGRLVLQAHERVLGPDHVDTLDAMSKLAVATFLNGERAAGTQLLVRALEAHQRVLGPEHPKTLLRTNELAAFYGFDGKPAAAQKLLQQVLELHERVLGPKHPGTISVLGNLASAYSMMGLYNEAEPLMVHVLELRQQVLGADHPSTLTSMSNLSFIYDEQGRFAEAAQLGARAIELGQPRLGAEHPRILAWMNNLGIFYLDEGKLEAAYRVLSRTLELRRRVLGPSHPDTVFSMSNLGLAQYRRGQLASAQLLLAQAWKASEPSLRTARSEVLGIAERLAAVCLARKEFAAAEDLLRKTSETRRRLTPDHWRTFATQSQLGEALVGQGRYTEAEPLLIAAYQGLKERAHHISAKDGKVLDESAKRILKLYSTWHKPAKQREWQREIGLHSM